MSGGMIPRTGLVTWGDTGCMSPPINFDAEDKKYKAKISVAVEKLHVFTK